MKKHLDLFSGIGGFSLASEAVWPEIEHTFCDNEPFSQAILKKHWPKSKIYGDIKTLKGSEIGPVDLLTGGFPCQPFSSAGNRRGKEDDRHLWPEMLRVIRETTPRWIIGENVSGLLTWSGGLVLDEVYADLEAEGYTVWSFAIPAVALNAPHRRERVWIIAYADGDGHGRYSKSRSKGGTSKKAQAQMGIKDGERNGNDPGRIYPSAAAPSNSSSSGRKGTKNERHRIGHAAWSNSGSWDEIAAELCTIHDGLSNGLARPRGWRNAALKGAGNAIVPQVAEVILGFIKTIDQSI